jgi:hypothetical protein
MLADGNLFVTGQGYLQKQSLVTMNQSQQVPSIPAKDQPCMA